MIELMKNTWKMDLLFPSKDFSRLICLSSTLSNKLVLIFFFFGRERSQQRHSEEQTIDNKMMFFLALNNVYLLLF